MTAGAGSFTDQSGAGGLTTFQPDLL